jgi:hypothetical protein
MLGWGLNISLDYTDTEHGGDDNDACFTITFIRMLCTNINPSKLKRPVPYF